jgi:hypothetical protein
VGEQPSAPEQSPHQRMAPGPSSDVPTRRVSPPASDSPHSPSAPRGPRSAVDGTGARLAAERFGLDWTSASASVRAVAAEASARVPEDWEIEGPGISLALGDAADIDPALLEAMLGPDGLGGEALGPQFGQDAAADALRPGPVLAALTEQAVADAAFLTDDQLAGAMHAAQRQKTRAAWQQTQASPPRPHCDLRRPRLQRPGDVLRRRPHHPLARRPHRPVQPRTKMQKAPSLQTSTRLVRRATRTRRHQLVPPQRPHSPDQTHRL